MSHLLACQLNPNQIRLKTALAGKKSVGGGRQSPSPFLDSHFNPWLGWVLHSGPTTHTH